MSPLNPLLPVDKNNLDIELKSLKRQAFISDFQMLSPRFRSSQAELLGWLSEAHAASGNMDRAVIETLFSRYGGASNQIAFRGHELEDFTHRRWDQMRLFGPKGSDLSQKTQFFMESAASAFERLYPVEAEAPGTIIHVTCTGYGAPSAAQLLVSGRGWGRKTQVLHAYHMGCYASHPALRMATGQIASGFQSADSVDVVHTELCSLHLDPARHEPAQIVIQSLFADGYIKYRVANNPSAHKQSFEILALHEEIIPESTGAMNWTPGPLVFTMTLSREVPTLLASGLPGFVQRLFAKAGFDAEAEKSNAVFAIHPGGPRIIELSERILNLNPAQTTWSRQVLREHGNMSSATLPTIWDKILQDNAISNGTLIVSLGAGPGLTVSGALFRKKQ